MNSDNWISNLSLTVMIENLTLFFFSFFKIGNACFKWLLKINTNTIFLLLIIIDLFGFKFDGININLYTWMLKY